MFGFERSGTTLLSMMVGAHPEIAVPLTVTGLWYVYAGRLGSYGSLATRDDVARLVDDLLAEERIKLWDVTLARDEVLQDLPVGSYPAVVRRFHELYARSKGKPHWGNLDIATLDEMDEANRWFPSARFLHIVRDGRDVSLSHETMPYGASNTLECAEKWTHRLGVNLKMGQILGPDRYKVIRYEDLVEKSESTLESICSFFGTCYSPAMLEYPRMVDEKVPEDRRWLWPALDKPPDRSKVYGWKKKMSPTKRIVFEGAGASMLEQLGYETYERMPKSLSAYAYELWCFLGRGGRVGRLQRRLGLKRRSKLEREWKGPSPPTDYRAVQQQAFGTLVRDGAYDEGFEHAPSMRAFFEKCLGDVFKRIDGGNGLRVLDCGCGPGAWMDVVYRMEKPRENVEYYGFDLTPEMVEVARKRLEGRVSSTHIHQGDILSTASYDFDGGKEAYQVMYAFDVVQQLPRRAQLDAVQTMLGRLARGGCVVIFDHDRWSPHGLRMGFKKLVTKYLGISLVPRYYCNARYPALARFASKLARSKNCVTEIKVGPDGKKER